MSSRLTIVLMLVLFLIAGCERFYRTSLYYFNTDESAVVFEISHNIENKIESYGGVCESSQDNSFVMLCEYKNDKVSMLAYIGQIGENRYQISLTTSASIFVLDEGEEELAQIDIEHEPIEQWVSNLLESYSIEKEERHFFGSDGDSYSL